MGSLVCHLAVFSVESLTEYFPTKPSDSSAFRYCKDNFASTMTDTGTEGEK